LSNTKHHKNINPYFYPPMNFKTKDKGNVKNTCAVKDQVCKNTEKTKKPVLENTCSQTVANPEIITDKNPEIVESPNNVENSGDVVISADVTKENTENISAKATEVTETAEVTEAEKGKEITEAADISKDSQKKAPESGEKTNQWFNPIGDLIKLYISNIKKTRRGL